MSIIDVDSYVGHFPYRKLYYNTLAGVAELAQQNDINIVCVSSMDAVFYRNCQDGNEELAEALADFSSSAVTFYPFAIINPHYTAWQRDVDDCIKQGFRGIELCPLYHGYNLGDDASVAAAEYARDHHLALRIRAGFEDSRQRHDLDLHTDVDPFSVASLVNRVPDARYILTGFFNAPTIYKHTHQNNNVYFSCWKADIYPAINDSFHDMTAVIPVSQLLLGSNSPFSYIEPEFIRLRNCHDLSDQDRQDIIGNNAERIFS